MHRRLLLVSLTAALALAPTAALAVGPASSATAVGVEGIVTISAVSSDGAATGVAVLGQELSGGDATVASSDAIGVPTDVVEVAIVESSTHEDGATANAARVTVGGKDGLEVTVLHAEASSDGSSTSAVALGSPSAGEVGVLVAEAEQADGGSAVLDLDGTRVVSNDHVGGATCAAELPLGELDVACVEATEDGAASRTVSAGLPTGQVGVVHARAAGGTVTAETPNPGPDPDPEPAPSPASAPVPGPAPVPADGPASPAPAPVGRDSGSTLPVAGAGLAGMLAGAMGMIGAGAGLLRRRG